MSSTATMKSEEDSTVYRLACVGTLLNPVGLRRVRKHSGSKTPALGWNQRDMWDSFRGAAKTHLISLYLAVLSSCWRRRGFKTPRAETHKSRLGWDKEEEVEVLKRGGWQGWFLFITNMEHGEGLSCYAADAPVNLSHGESAVPGWRQGWAMWVVLFRSLHF